MTCIRGSNNNSNWNNNEKYTNDKILHQWQDLRINSTTIWEITWISNFVYTSPAISGNDSLIHLQHTRNKIYKGQGQSLFWHWCNNNSKFSSRFTKVA